jgi:manganese-transporting P-type ATPase
MDTNPTTTTTTTTIGFALIASGYILTEGLKKGEKTTHELLLRCVIIVTSVVPRQLPMQMAMAVNMALMSLGMFILYIEYYCTILHLNIKHDNNYH